MVCVVINYLSVFEDKESGLLLGPGWHDHVVHSLSSLTLSKIKSRTTQQGNMHLELLTTSKRRALLLLCTVAIVMASVINLTSARYMPQGYNARAPARSMEEIANNEGIITPS